MNSLADALVQAVAYIECRGSETDEDLMEYDYLDDDLRALESIGATLQEATDEEKDALAAAAKRALAEEMSGIARPSYVEFYASFMSSFLHEGWEGNERI